MDKILSRTVQLLKDGAKGIIFGESHDTPVAPNWLITNLASLKRAGVTTIFLETNQKHQPVIDTYMRSNGGEADEIQLRGALQFLGASPANEIAYESLIIQAKAQGLRVIAMDIDEPKISEENDNRTVNEKKAARLVYSNSAWADFITLKMKNQPEGAKYAVLAGVAHTGQVSGTDTPGVDDILGVPSVDLYEVQHSQDVSQFIKDTIDPSSSDPVDIMLLGVARPSIYHTNSEANDYMGLIPGPTNRDQVQDRAR